MPLLIGATILLLILFNVLSGVLFGYSFLDITSDKRYSLTDTTLDFLKQNQTNMTIRFYASSDIKQNNLSYSHYADYVNRLLSKYSSRSHGKIKLETIEVEPYSSAEVEAEKSELRPLYVGSNDNHIYLGANIISSNSKALNIPAFEIKRKSMLEDDISRLLSIINSTNTPTIGIISPHFNISAKGKIMSLNSEWPFIKQLRASGYRIINLDEKSASIPSNIDVLLVFYPFDMLAMSVYAIDQYLLRGGNVIVMLDAFSEIRYAKEHSYHKYESGLDGFLNHLGIKYYNDIVVGDLYNNQNIVIDGQKTSYPFYLRLSKEQQADHPIFNGINNINMNYASLLSLNEDKTNLKSTILISTGNNSGIFPAHLVPNFTYNELKQRITSGNKAVPLALLLEGKFDPFYKTPLVNDPEFLAGLPPFINFAQDEGKLVIIGDSDMMAWSLWRGDDDNGQLFYSSDNVLFLRGIIDYLSNSNFIQIGQKSGYHKQYNLSDVLQNWIYKRAYPLQEQINKRLSQVYFELNQLTISSGDEELGVSAGKSKKIFDLQKQATNLEQMLKQLNYKISDDYRKLLTYFAIAMMLLPCLLAVLFVWVIYYFYKRRYLSSQRKKVYE